MAWQSVAVDITTFFKPKVLDYYQEACQKIEAQVVLQPHAAVLEVHQILFLCSGLSFFCHLYDKGLIALYHHKNVANIFAPLLHQGLLLEPQAAWVAGQHKLRCLKTNGTLPVSYTHLTLPTKRIV